MTNKAMSVILELLHDAFDNANIPSSFYNAQMIVCYIGETMQVENHARFVIHRDGQPRKVQVKCLVGKRKQRSNLIRFYVTFH